MNVMQALSNSGVNPHAVTLLCESLLRSPLAKMIAEKGEPLKFFFPIQRSDCAEWDGVEIQLLPIAKEKPKEGEG